MKKVIFFSTLFLSAFAFASISANAQSIRVAGSLEKRSASRGSSVEATVIMEIPSQLHVNSNKPASEYAIPTVVSVRSPGVKSGRIKYPRGRNRRFQFSENLINVYEGRVKFTFTITVPSNFRGKVIRVIATVRYQPCTNEVCYPPTSKSVTMTARVN